MASMRFEIPEIGSIILRDETGRDVMDAHRAVKKYGADPDVDIRTLMRCITHVDDKPVIYPWLEWLNWSAETKTLVKEARYHMFKQSMMNMSAGLTMMYDFLSPESRRVINGCYEDNDGLNEYGDPE